MPDAINTTKAYRAKSRKFWLAWLGRNHKLLKNALNKKYVYGNATATRFYTGYTSETDMSETIKLFRQIWNDKDVVIVEGEKTRMGVGNDLFDNCRSIQRVLIPAENAFSKYENILAALKEFDKKCLFLIAAGPTATVLAYDMARAGYQALDVGHLDIQYEYYLRQTGDKVNISGKYVNEVAGGANVSDDIEGYEAYSRQVIKVIS